MRIFAVILVLCSLGACSARQCKLDGAYLESRETGAMVNPDNGELPARDPVYDIPPIPEGKLSASRSYTDAQGLQKTDCIDRPPRISPTP